MADPIDFELIDIINRLHQIQSVIGGAKFDESKPVHKLDRFIDLKVMMLERLKEVKDQIELVSSANQLVGGNPRDLIAIQSQIRRDLTHLTTDWNELDSLYRAEASKRKSKLSPEEVKNRLDIVVAMQEDIETLKELQRASHVHDYRVVKLAKFEDSEITKPANAEYNPQLTHQRNKNITENQRIALLRIKERDKKIDDEIELIGKGVDELGEIARTANEEVKLQSVVLGEELALISASHACAYSQICIHRVDMCIAEVFTYIHANILTSLHTLPFRITESMEEKIEDVHDRMLTLNQGLRNTLDETRKSDKICVDIFCFLLLVGMIGILIKVSEDNKEQ
jgi:hypothetical protein